MWRFILVSFAFMGWSFYVLSDGNDYAPRDGSRQAVALIEARTPKIAKIARAKPKPAVKPAAVVTLASVTSEPVLDVKPGRLTKNFVAARVTDENVIIPQVDTTKVAALVAPANPEFVSTGDIRAIKGTRVNMRSGPSTSDDIAAKLTGGTKHLGLLPIKCALPISLGVFRNNGQLAGS